MPSIIATKSTKEIKQNKNIQKKENNQVKKTNKATTYIKQKLTKLKRLIKGMLKF